jgi:catechol 2,3-dioxygenase-like lactoylglutathione lyase family enzyme
MALTSVTIGTPGPRRLAAFYQQIMEHLDIEVDDLDEAVAWATSAGATLAEYQPQPDIRVLLDPDGHPFCVFLA